MSPSLSQHAPSAASRPTDVAHQVLATARAMWQRRWIGFAVAWIVGGLAAAVVFKAPERYEATARVYVDTQTVLRPLMTGIAVQPDVDRMVAMLGRNLISRPNIEQLVSDEQIRFEPEVMARRELLIEGLMKDIKLTGGGQNQFNLNYRDSDRERARLVLEKMVKMFVATGRGDKQRDTEEARRFIDEQIAAHEQKLREAENRLKDFKLKNFGLTGAAGQDSFTRMATIQEDLSRVRLELRAHTEARDSLRRQLAGESAVVSAGPQSSSAGSSAALGPSPEFDARLDGLRRQLDDLLRRFTEEHPDVVNTRRLINQLEAQRRAEIEALSKSPGGPTREQMSANPVFQRLKIALAESESQVASSSARAAELQSRLDSLRATAARYPQVEAELAQLNRDYDIIKRNYEQLVQRRESAAISQDVDANSLMTDFRIIEPPHVLPAPVFPSKKMMVLLGLIAALAAGVAATFVLVSVAPTVQSPAMLRRATARPVLGVLSMQVDTALLRKERRETLAFAWGSGLLVLLYVAWIAALKFVGAG
jgi:polysaccharide chain length determinant protein (PEP-CTERM system associated)